MNWIVRHPRVFFILLSASIWLVDRLSADDAELTLSYALNYEDVPSVLRTGLPKQIDLQLEGKGYNLFWEYIRQRRKLIIDLSELQRKQASDVLQLGDLLYQVEQQLPEGVALREMKDERKSFSLPAFASLPWPVRERVPEGLQLPGYSVVLSGLPKSAMVTGLEEAHRILQSPHVNIRYKGSFPGEGVHNVLLELEPSVSGSWEVEPNDINVQASIALSTTFYKTVSLNVDESDSYLFVPSEVKLAFSVEEGEYERISKAPIELQVDLDNAMDGLVPLKLNAPQEWIDKLLYMSSDKVRYVIQSKQ